MIGGAPPPLDPPLAAAEIFIWHSIPIKKLLYLRAKACCLEVGSCDFGDGRTLGSIRLATPISVGRYNSLPVSKSKRAISDGRECSTLTAATMWALRAALGYLLDKDGVRERALLVRSNATVWSGTGMRAERAVMKLTPRSRRVCYTETYHMLSALAAVLMWLTDTPPTAFRRIQPRSQPHQHPSRTRITLG